MVKHISCLPVILVLICSPALAAFNSGGLETFSGTTLDPTWIAIDPQIISQNNGLIMSGANTPASAQYTSSYAEVNIGGSAQVQVIITAQTSIGDATQDAFLGLTTNNNKSEFIYTGMETYSLLSEANINPSQDFFEGVYYSGSSNEGIGGIGGVSLNQLYTLSLDRLSATSVMYSAMNSAGQTLFSETETWPAGYSGPLFVAVGAESVNAEFSNLQLGDNFVLPEPASTMWLSIGSILWLGRRRSN